MTGPTRVELLRAVRTRDAFLVAVATQLEARVARLPAADPLHGFARELSIIAAPRRPVAVRARRVELTGVISRMFTPAALAGRGAVVEVTRGGAVTGRWDAELLESIFAELVSNAVKYSKGAPVTIRVRLRGARALVVIGNAGAWSGPVGPIARFRREETRGVVRGFGVGLWLARRLARAHGGDLRFARRDGETLAIVALPFTSTRGDVSRFAVRLTRAGSG